MELLEQKKRKIINDFYNELLVANPDETFTIHEPKSYDLSSNYMHIIGTFGRYANDFIIEIKGDFILPVDSWVDARKDIPHSCLSLQVIDCPTIPDDYDVILVQSLNPNSEQTLAVHFIGGKAISFQKNRHR